MRVLAVFAAGLVLGCVLTFGSVQVAGGWYTYVTLGQYACLEPPAGAEVVPHQPNPCHFRRPRWRLLY